MASIDDNRQQLALSRQQAKQKRASRRPQSPSCRVRIVRSSARRCPGPVLSRFAAVRTSVAGSNRSNC